MVLNDRPDESVSFRILYLVSINHAINDGSTNLISTLFPVVVTVFRFPSFQVGVLVAVGYLTNMVFQPITGRYSESFESRKLLALGIAIIGGSMILFTLSSTFWLMLVTIIILRTGSSFFHPVGVSAVSRSYSGRELDRAMGFESAFGNLGVFAVFLASAPLYSLLGWRGPFLVFAILDLLVVAITLVLMKKRVPIIRESQNAPNRIRGELSTPPSTFGLPVYFIVTMLISGGAYAVFANFGNLLLNNSFSLDESNSLMAGWVLAAFFGAILTGPMTKRVARKTLLVLFYFVAAVTTLAFGLFSSVAFLVPVVLLTGGFALSATYPMIYSQLSAFLGEKSQKKGSSFGILFSAQIIGSSILGLLGGYLASGFGWSFPFEITSVLLISGCIAGLFWVDRSLPMNTSSLKV